MTAPNLDHWPAITNDQIEASRNCEDPSLEDVDSERRGLSVKVTIGDDDPVETGCWRYAMSYVDYVCVSSVPMKTCIDITHWETPLCSAFASYKIYASIVVVRDDSGVATKIEFRDLNADDHYDSVHGDAVFRLDEWQMYLNNGYIHEELHERDLRDWTYDNRSGGPTLEEVPLVRSPPLVTSAAMR